MISEERAKMFGALNFTRGESERWRELTAKLVAVGAITPDDLQAQTVDARRTPGLEVLGLIRDWADDYAMTAGQHAQELALKHKKVWTDEPDLPSFLAP